LSITAQGNTVDGLDFIDCHLGVSNGSATGAQRMMVEVWTAHGTSNWWRNVHFHGCEFEASNVHQLDFACYGDAGQATGVIVEDCVFHGGGVRDYGTRFGYGIVLEWPSNVMIRNNTFHRCRETAVMGYNPGGAWPTDTGWVITGNTFDWDTAEQGITARWGIVILRSAHNLVTNNTFNVHATRSPGCVYLSTATATANLVTGNTFNLNQAQIAIAEANGASGNTLAPNIVSRS